MRLKTRDAQKILMQLEEGLNLIQRMDKTDKMRMRKKIRNEVSYVVQWQNPTADRILTRLEEKLQDLFRKLPYGFSDDLRRLLNHLIRQAEEQETKMKAHQAQMKITE